MRQVGKSSITTLTVRRDTDILAKTGTKPLFVVTGKVLLTHLLGEVTVVIQTQADNTRLQQTSIAGVSTNLCADNNITADAVGSFYTITGTIADAMVNSATTPAMKLATALTINAGTIDMVCAATNTGSVKWTLMYIPLEAGATINAI